MICKIRGAACHMRSRPGQVVTRPQALRRRQRTGKEIGRLI